MSKEDISFKVDGINDLVKNLESFPKEVYSEAQESVVRAANKILEDARTRAPEKTGKLKRWFRLETLTDILRESVSVQVVNLVPYAHLLEYGHVMTTNREGKGKGKLLRVVPAKPFMRPALEANTQNAIDEMINGVNQAIAKIESKSK